MFRMSIKNDLAVAVIPKAGLQTIGEWLGRDFPQVPNDQAIQVSRRVAFFRHPLERLRSCYSFMYWNAEYGYPSKALIPVDSWESFVDHILVVDNEHWRPQTAHAGVVPTVYHRFENIADHFEKYRPGLLPHNNRATRRPTSDYRKAEITALYSDDFSIWEAAT